MSNISFSLLVADKISSISYGGTTDTVLNIQRSYGTTSSSYIFIINYSVAQPVDSIVLYSLNQLSGLSFLVELSGASSYSNTFSQYSETLPRKTSNQLLVFPELAATQIKVTISGISSGLSIGTILPFAETLTPALNYDNGAQFGVSNDKTLSTSNVARFATIGARFRTYDLTLDRMDDDEAEALTHLVYMEDKNPMLVKLDGTTAAAKWMVATSGQVSITSPRLNNNNAPLTFNEAYAWL